MVSVGQRILESLVCAAAAKIDTQAAILPIHEEGAGHFGQGFGIGGCGIVRFGAGGTGKNARISGQRWPACLVKRYQRWLPHISGHNIVPGIMKIVGFGGRTGVVDGLLSVPFLRNALCVVIGVHPKSQTPLPGVVQAGRRLRLSFGCRQRRQKQPGQNGDDGNDDQQFDQGEAAPGRPEINTRQDFSASCFAGFKHNALKKN